MKLQQTIVLVFLCIYILIVILGTRKSNTAVAHKRKPLDTWAIIDNEFVEFTEEEIEWRESYVRR